MALGIVITKQVPGDKPRRISLYRATLELQAHGYSKELAFRLMTEAFNTITLATGTIYDTTEAKPRGDQ